jgi:vacuolar protein sorting-associated protein 16
MIGPYGDWLRFPYEGVENLYLIPEIDCCRVITDSSVEIIQRVPPATSLLLRICSIEASAMLLDASDAFHAGSPSSDETARSIVKTGLLQEAIETCTDSAMKEFDIQTQKRLLRAASYGMHFSYKTVDSEHAVLMGGSTSGSAIERRFLPSEITIKFVAAARKIRVLNALRNPNVGFILTSAQYDAMTPAGVIARLIAMKRAALATGISKYLSLPKSVQLFARASKAAAFVESDKGHTDKETADAAIRIIDGESSKIREGTGGDVVRQNTATRSSSCLNRGCFATVAIAAQRAGRPGVANILLALESSVADKVPALISTGAYPEAIAVAISARYVLFFVKSLFW